MSKDRKPENTAEHQAQQDKVNRMTGQAERRWEGTNPEEGVDLVCAVPGCEEAGKTRIKGQAEVPGVDGLIEVTASICDEHRIVILNGGMHEYSIRGG